ncbi:MAG: ribonuclease H-like domain-containing protein [Chitinophagaceae bacterium]|nr:ribonuclease H-like domain-containing protein [Chitinophagaceae bacterium]
MPIDPNKILFLDIETASQREFYSELNNDTQVLWDSHTRSRREIKDPEKDTSETVYNRAAIYAEFGKIICVSCGYLTGNGEDRKLCVKSFCCEEEADLLRQLYDLLQRWGNKDREIIDQGGKPEHYLCAHNGKEFDFPYMSRRMLINGIPLPEILNNYGKKPWEVPHLDTMELWRFGDWKNFTTLNLLAHVFKVPSPKSDMDGSKIYEVYYKEKNLPRIVDYCEKDVVTLTQVYLRMNGFPLVKDENITIKYE